MALFYTRAGLVDFIPPKGRRYFPRRAFDLRADKVQRPIHRQTVFSLVDLQNVVDLGNEIILGTEKPKACSSRYKGGTSSVWLASIVVPRAGF